MLFTQQLCDKFDGSAVELWSFEAGGRVLLVVFGTGWSYGWTGSTVLLTNLMCMSETKIVGVYQSSGCDWMVLHLQRSCTTEAYIASGH